MLGHEQARSTSARRAALSRKPIGIEPMNLLAVKYSDNSRQADLMRGSGMAGPPPRLVEIKEWSRNDGVTWPDHRRIMWFVDPIRQRSLGVAGRRALIPSLLLSITGCATDGRSAAATEAARRAVIGMAQPDAIRRMGNAGFACGTAPDGVDCSRSSRRGMLTTCVQHIRFHADPMSGRVDQVDAPEPACFGGFG